MTNADFDIGKQKTECSPKISDYEGQHFKIDKQKTQRSSRISEYEGRHFEDSINELKFPGVSRNSVDDLYMLAAKHYFKYCQSEHASDLLVGQQATEPYQTLVDKTQDLVLRKSFSGQNLQMKSAQSNPDRAKLYYIHTYSSQFLLFDWLKIPSTDADHNVDVLRVCSVIFSSRLDRNEGISMIALLIDISQVAQ